MKLRKETIHQLSHLIAQEMVDKGFVHLKTSREGLEERIRRVITEDLMVEDKLNEEVRQILTSHAREIESGRVDYSRMFQLVKSKLVRERGLVL